MLDAFKAYFEQIKKLDSSDATEHTLRPALQSLLSSIANERATAITIIHEPKRDKGGSGAPDFKFKTHECIVGYLENKSHDENLDKVLKSEQIAKYKALSSNIILTNHLEWLWLKDGTINLRDTFCYTTDVAETERPDLTRTRQLKLAT